MSDTFMNTPVITMPADQAEQHYKEYLELVKTRKEKYLEDLKQTYYHLAKERKIIDIIEVFKNSGVDDKGEPKLAIAPANARAIMFEKGSMGSATFTEYGKWSRATKSDVQLPTGTFPTFLEEKDGRIPTWGPGSERCNVEAQVPIIPAHIMPEGDLKNYYILFEVTGGWSLPHTSTFKKGDPYLLKRINHNAFAVLAEWDVTELEAAVLRGV